MNNLHHCEICDTEKPYTDYMKKKGKHHVTFYE